MTQLITIRDERGRFVKGNAPFKGTKGILKANSGSFKIGDIPWHNKKTIKDDKRLIPMAKFKEKNPTWTGDNATYWAIHRRIIRKFGKASEHGCKLCNSKEHIDWANVDHKYTMELKKWIPLCKKCHRKYDKEKKQWNKII